MSTKRLAAAATNITSYSTYRLPEGMKKSALLCVNTYVGTRNSLGDGPANDGVTMAKLLKTYGFDVYYLLNPRKSVFLSTLAHFLKNTEEHLVVYYTGHGTYVRDVSGDEDDYYDEAMVFVDGNVIDDTLLEYLNQNKNAESVATLVSDCCHSGTIWDLQSKNCAKPPKCVSIGAASDRQTAKQTVVEKLEQGLFTYNTKKLLTKTPELSPNDLQTKLRPLLRSYAQTVVVESTDDSIPRDPVFGSKVA